MNVVTRLLGAALLLWVSACLEENPDFKETLGPPTDTTTFLPYDDTSEPGTETGSTSSGSAGATSSSTSSAETGVGTTGTAGSESGSEGTGESSSGLSSESSAGESDTSG